MKRIDIRDLSQGDEVVITNKGEDPAVDGFRVRVICDPWQNPDGEWRVFIKFPRDYQSVEIRESKKDFYM